MDRLAVESFLCRAAAAESVRELHAIAQAVRGAHPEDADAELIERVCWAAVPRLFTIATPRATPTPAPRPSPEPWRAAGPAYAPAEEPAYGRGHAHGRSYARSAAGGEAFDWRARAAGM